VTNTNFADLGLAERLLAALEDANYQTPTPIQSKAIPQLLKGRDLLGIAQTGTGKTAAFTLPLLHKLQLDGQRPDARRARALIMAPTRELVIQISESIETYGARLQMRHTVIMGGVSSKRQIDAMRRGVDIIVATPGRLLDLIQQGHVDLCMTDNLILDEADRMLDMGFIRDVRKIIAKMPTKRQTLLFSATMPAEVAKLAGDILNNPERVEITAKTVAVDRIHQQVYHMEAAQKRRQLSELLADPKMERVIVFTRTKHGANKVVKNLANDGIGAEAIHGNKSQGARQRALENFRAGQMRVLVATDIASRGIDIDDVTHVINYELPNIAESYVHRIGRTARAGATGTAISFCDISERPHLRGIERLIKQTLEVVGDIPSVPEGRPATKGDTAKPRPAQRHRRRRGRPQRERRKAA